MLSKIYKYKFSLISAILILYVSVIRLPEVNLEIVKINGFDKVVHILMYAWLSWIIFFESKLTNNYRHYPLILIICTIFGGVIEILQYFSPPRTASWGDFLANATGAALPLAIVFFYYKNGKFRKSKANRP